MKEYELIPHRLGLMDSPMKIASSLCEGNPGAMRVVGEFLRLSNTNIDYIKYLLVFDSLEVYGSRIWIFYKDCCGENLQLLMKVIDSMIEGKISSEEVLAHIDDDCGRGKPFAESEINNG